MQWSLFICSGRLGSKNYSFKNDSSFIIHHFTSGTSVLEAMSETVCAMISDPCDAYWITSCMYENRHKFTRMFAKLPKYVKYYLQLEDKRLFEHLCEMQVKWGSFISCPPNEKIVGNPD